MKRDALTQFTFFRTALFKEKSELEQRLKRINQALGGKIPTPLRARRAAPQKPSKRPTHNQAPRSRKKRRPIGQLKRQIVRALKAAGKEGVTVTDLAQKLGARYNNISIWFLRAGKKLKAIKKVGPARYAWVSA